MTRRAFFALPVAFAACGGKREAAIDIFPETLAGWRRTSRRDVPVSESPDPVPRGSVVRVRSAVYEGPGRLESRAYELANQTVGLDIAQRWRPSADTVFFWAQRWFVVIQWQQSDRKALQQFTTALETRLNQT